MSPTGKIILHDISLPLSSGTLLYPGDPPLRVERLLDHANGDSLFTSSITLSCHVGTHVDAPAHFLKEGKTIDCLPLQSFYGPAVVVASEDRAVIGLDALTRLHLPKHHHLLFKTNNSSLLHLDHYTASHCVMAPEAAEFLCSRQPLSIGFDYYSLDPPDLEGTFPAHIAFAGCNIPVFVCLDLLDILPGAYTFVGFPLRLTGMEASPVRACLITSE